MVEDRRSRKRLAMRQGISDAATRLFFERGFDHVTVGEIAEAADVARKTVFNHFPRKEDMFFDRDQEFRETLRDALRQRDLDIAPIKALHSLTHRLVASHSPLIEFSAASKHFVATIESSETLKARARAIRDELAQFLAGVLSACVGRESTDPDAHLAANLFVTTCTVAVIRAHWVFRKRRKRKEAKAVFLALFDQGFLGLKAAMAGTPYV